MKKNSLPTLIYIFFLTFTNKVNAFTDNYAEAKDPTKALSAIETAIANLIFNFRNLVIVVAVIFILVASINLTTSSGDPEKAKKAKETITWALAAIIIAVALWPLLSIILIQMFGLPIPEDGVIKLFLDPPNIR